MKKLISFTLVAALLCMLAVAAAGAVSAADKADITINGFNCPAVCISIRQMRLRAV